MDPKQAPNGTGQFEQVVERLRPASNVLVTVRTNPTVDQLAACLGLTIVLNKMNKHATAVFSGEVPSTIDFLHPEKTLEKNTDSLRDFIIALDKAKADKLRYKVEDSVVKIFITPYKTSIDEKDLNFSQGDFNIDAVVALGVHDKAQLDAAILAHGRILHDATVMSLDTSKGGSSQIGSISWIEPNASSLSEMVGDIARDLSPDVFDEQISTALLTGIVSETDRFSNQKVTPHSMSIAGILMAAGASTQLVTTKLQEASKKKTEERMASQEEAEKPANDDGLLEIEHNAKEEDENHAKEHKGAAKSSQVKPLFDDRDSPKEDSLLSEEMPPLPPTEPTSEEEVSNHVILEPPKLGGQLTANSIPEYKQYSDTTDPLSLADEAKDAPILSRNDTPKRENNQSISEDQTLSQIEKTIESPHLHSADTIAADNGKTLKEIEEVVESPHLSSKKKDESSASPLDDARDAVTQAEFEDDYRPEPISALGAQPVDLDFGNNQDQAPQNDDTDVGDDSSSPPPPPVPPPMMPPAQ